jgi:hypothetical protein
MTDKKRFASVMLSMSLALKMYGRELSTELQQVYWNALQDLTDDQFEFAAAVVMRRDTEFPTPSQLLEIARPPAEDPQATAARMLDKALMLSEHCPHSGTWWSGERIRHTLGEAAYQAFHACGGSPAFRQVEDPYHGARVRRDFVECYMRVMRADPLTCLPVARTPMPLLAPYTTGIAKPIPGGRP